MRCEINLLKAIILVFSFFYPRSGKKCSGLFRVCNNNSGTLLAAQEHRPCLSSTWELLPQQWQCEGNRAAAEPPALCAEGQFLHTVTGLHIKTCLERRREKCSGQATNNAKSQAFIINNCLLSDTLTLLSADVTIKGSAWAKTEGRWGQETWKRWLARTRVPPDSDEGCFDTGDSRNRQYLQEELQGGGRHFWILNLLKLDQIFCSRYWGRTATGNTEGDRNDLSCGRTATGKDE